MGGAAADREEPGLEALTTLWRERGLSPSGLEARSDGTLIASDRQLSIDAARAGGGAAEAELAGEPLSVEGELGRGGMGVVHRAEQLALRREVAIKRLALSSPRGLEGLLKEAWLGGHLEHPNVVPVHALAAHEGEPAIVMKRVEGRSWRAFIEDPSALPETDREDALGWHLRVLTSVCDAVQLAHSRGVLHLDLKPDNVMIGAFGEVYVLDWGLAAGCGEEAPAWLPRASSLRGVAGTPDYMAPELAAGAGDRLDPRTDVYLLGACLHEVVTGSPPHAGETPLSKLLAAHLSAAHAYGEDVPAELASILRRAMHRDPEARIPDVASLRAAVEAFLAHREADTFVREARERLARLEARWSESGGEAELFRELGACRFALREARSIWPEHPELAALEARLRAGMAEWAMAEDRLELAASYLSELTEPRPDLEERLAGLRRSAEERAARVATLEHLARDQDLSKGSRFRRRVGLALGLSFVLVNAAMGAAERAGIASLGYVDMLWTGVISLAVLAPYGWWRRRLFFRNRANAALFSVCIGTFFTVQGLWLVGMTLDLPFRSALALTPLFYLLAFGAATMLVSLRFFASPLLQVPTLLLAATVPEHVYEIIGVGGGVSAALIGLVWKPEQGEDA